MWLTCCRNWKLLLSFWKKRFPREISRCKPDVFHEVVFNEDVATSLGFRQGICSSHLTLCLTLDFIFELCSKACPDLKIFLYIFCWYLLVTWPCRHRWKIFGHKTYQFWCQWKENFILVNICCRTYSWFLSFMSYWPSKNA